MTTWTLSDGTTVTSDGTRLEVGGSSAFAEHLRMRLEDDGRILVPESPAPTQMPLNPASARNVDAWIDYEIRSESADVVVSSRPEIEPALPDVDTSDEPKTY